MKKVESATVKHARRFVFRRLDNMREVRHHIGLWILAMGLIIAATGLQLFWYQQSYRTMAYANDGTYAEAVLGPVETLNPIFASTSAEESASSLIFSRLMTYDTTGNLNYDLAEKMTISQDQRKYTFTIRPDARWQDGVYVRAQDIVYTVNLLQNPATRSTITGWDDITVEAADDRTVVFTLPAVYAAFTHALNFLPILPEHILRDVEPSALRENSFSQSPIGSGPFSVRFIQEVDEVSGRKIIHLTRNTSYYRGAPKLERFQLHVYPTSDEIIRAVKTAEVTAATDLTVEDTRQLELERYAVDRRPINSGVYALFNTSDGVLSDKKIRQALQVGTDVVAIRDAVGEGTPALGLPFINGQLTGKVPQPPSYDKQRAERLLDSAGWKLDKDGVRKKRGVPLRLDVVTTTNNDLERALGTMTEQWRALGITVTTSIVDPRDRTQNVVQNVLQQRNYDVLLYQLIIGDTDVFAYWHSSQVEAGRNFSNYQNAVSDEALLTARGRIEPALRNAKYLTFARQWLADAPAIGLYQVTTQYVYSKSVHALPHIERMVFPTDRYADVLYWRVGERFVQRTP